MNKVHVKASQEYDVLISAGLLADAGELVKSAAGGSRALIVSDSNVAALYLSKLQLSLKSAGYEVHSHVIPAGEVSKNWETLGETVAAAAAAHLSRRDLVVALGGGVVGDLAGFAAAVYMRGISYVQIPTTVLSAVDSSVGGKTAVDLAAGKNLVGVFYQPKLVICDTDCWESLPERERSSGYAEIIKYAMIKDPAVLDMLDGPVEDLVARCVEIKAQVVEADEKEAGERQLLNFGHTIGHAIEQASNHGVLHGEAVARGMLLACDVAKAMGRLEEGTDDKLRAALMKYGLPVAGGVDKEALWTYMRSDKKADGNAVNFVMPEAVGRCTIECMKIKDIIGVL
ncbi:MAG: 3-dehydroquinate synthase [Firmicutes bacterium]|nr:3-dehydroquinate synthase [Bacillota bacterium]